MMMVPRSLAMMAARFRNPLMNNDERKVNEQERDPYDDMPELDYNSNNAVRSSEAPEESSHLPCNCFRPTSAVFCNKCGYIFTGRMRITCERHPKVIHLMDSSNCPRCRGTFMKEYAN